LAENDGDQRRSPLHRLVRGESNVLENQRKATDYEYDSGDDKQGERVAS